MPSSNSQQVEALPAADLSTLPLSSSTTLQLMPADPEETIQSALINMKSWRGPLSAEGYLRREKHIGSTTLTHKGGLTNWILVDSVDKTRPRTILAACETILKRGIVAKKDCEVEDLITHAIGGVFTRDEYRGRGYAARMMQELGKTLQQWQQTDGRKGRFNVLYSDIGKV